MDYGIYDIFYGLYDYFSEVLVAFRRFLFTTGAGEIRNFKYFFFAGIPLLFAAFEAIFDYLIPTFTDLQPMGIKRFSGMRFDRLKTPDLKSYSPVKSDTFRSTFRSRFNPRFKSYKSDLKLTSPELRHYQVIYQQRFNTTASPMQLKHFIISEGKHYNYSSGYTGLSADNKISTAVKDISLLGKGVKDTKDDIKAYKKNLEEEERRKAF